MSGARIQFSIRTILTLVALSGWLVCVFMPGGLYVTLPIGIGVLLFFSCIDAICSLRKLSAKRSWRMGQFVVSSLMLIALLVIYPPFWSSAARHANRERMVSAKRDYIFKAMDAESVREDGRVLLSEMQSGSIKTLFPSDPTVPDSLRKLEPVYMEARDEYLLVVLGNEDRFYLLIYAEGAEGRGTQRLCEGVWFFQSGSGKRWIVDSEWEEGIRE